MTTILSVTIGAAAGIVAAETVWALGKGLINFAGWAIVGWRHRGSGTPWPFGWRVFFGPRAYVRWAARKEFGVRLLNPVTGWDE